MLLFSQFSLCYSPNAYATSWEGELKLYSNGALADISFIRFISRKKGSAAILIKIDFLILINDFFLRCSIFKFLTVICRKTMNAVDVASVAVDFEKLKF